MTEIRLYLDGREIADIVRRELKEMAAERRMIAKPPRSWWRKLVGR